MNKEPDQKLSRLSQPFSVVVVRSAVFSVFLGSILTAVNQWEAITGSRDFDLLSLCLVYLSPFLVVTISQITAFKQASSDSYQNAAANIEAESVAMTMISHGIPKRAVKTGLMLGAFNSSLVLGTELLGTDHQISIPFLLLGQSFILPVIFGIFSQAVSYRRTLRAHVLQAG